MLVFITSLCVGFLQVDEKAKKGGFFKGLMQELFVKKIGMVSGVGVSLKEGFCVQKRRASLEKCR